MTERSLYAKVIFNHFSKRETISHEDIEHFGARVREKLAQITSTNSDFDQYTEQKAFEQDFGMFQSDPIAYLSKIQDNAGPKTAADPVSGETAAVLTTPASSSSIPLPQKHPTGRNRLSAYVIGATLAAGFLGAAYLLQNSGCSVPFSGCADSGWLAADSNSNYNLAFTHGLGKPPRHISLFYKHSLEEDVSYPVIQSWAATETGNPVTVAVSSTEVVLSIYEGAPLHGTWTPAGGWRKQKQGFFRIIVTR